jgi:shikimate kinase
MTGIRRRKENLARQYKIKQTTTVAEIVGPAGAGKTTLLRALCQRDKKILPGIWLHKTSYIPFLIGDVLRWLPAYLSHHSSGRWFNWSETRSMIYLRAWQQALQHRTSQNDVVTILDQGPIFRLAFLREFGPEITGSQAYDRWWNSMLERWAGILKVVICLDAQDGTLLNRVHTRSKGHFIKGKSEHEIYEFLARSRSAYQNIFAQISSSHGPTFLYFDTEKQSPDQIADHVLSVLDAKRKAAHAISSEGAGP